MSNKKEQYYTRTPIPVKILPSSSVRVTIVEGSRKEKGDLLGKRVPVTLLVVFLVVTQTLVLSAFEAHVVNVTAHICAPSETRTMGYWKNHLDLYEACFPVEVGGVVVDKEGAEAIFKQAKAKDMESMLRAQTLAMTLNMECFGIDATEGEEYDGMTLQEIVDNANRLLAVEDSSREEMEYYKDLIDHLNNEPYIKYCSSSALAASEEEESSEEVAVKDEKEEKGTVLGEASSQELDNSTTTWTETDNSSSTNFNLNKDEL